MSRFKILWATLLLIIATALPFSDAHAASDQSFAQIPILHEGRIKPMDSFARAELKMISGQERIDELGALDWLKETLFDPARAVSRPVIRVTNPEILRMLGLKADKSRLYSYENVAHALDQKGELLRSILSMEEDGWTPAQADFITLHQNTMALDQIMNSLSLYLPLAFKVTDSHPEFLQPYKNTPLTYERAYQFQSVLQNFLKDIITRKGDKIDHYNATEQELAYLSFSLTALHQKGQQNTLFKVIPQADGEWISPWEALLEDKGGTALGKQWQALTSMSRLSDDKTWHFAAQRMLDSTLNAADRSVRKHALNIEYLYNALQPFTISFIFYALALLLLIVKIMLDKPFWVPTAAAFAGAGLLFHAAGLAMRIYILARPPVSTLYESVLFVGFIAVAYGLAVWLFKRKPYALAGAAIAGAVLQQIGFAHEGDGDSMMMLTAVLNTNFWLATHVLCISTGYAFCIITSVLAHFVLAQWGTEGKRNEDLYRAMHTAGVIALLFAAVGTVLGGIWADQSWGRFWGWDPKENGALLITLWLIWVLHGRVSNHIKPVYFAALLGYLSVIVGLSWFGVNLLSVGLHAYGFTDSAAWSLGAFIAVQTLLLAALVLRVLKRRSQHAH